LKNFLLLILILASLNSFAATYNATIEVNPQSESSWRINKLLFGSFLEEWWGDLTPGIYEQYLANPSFEKWKLLDTENKTRIVFLDVQKINGIAYPWESVNTGSGISYNISTDNPFNSKQSQHVVVCSNEKAGVKQKLALPDYRTLNYRYKLFIRKKGNVTVKIELADVNTNSVSLNRTLISGITNYWKSFEGKLILNQKFSSKFNRKYGIGELIFTVEGDGEVWIDQVSLFPADCVEGIFNPETIDHVKKFKIKMARWPGGNYTSGYHWRDGIGPIDKRPTKLNHAWGGQADNQFGLDEFLRFCELTGIIPVMGVGFNLPEIDKYEIADWVEYCNGGTNTPMGHLRAQNGHMEPYNIINWGVGNEVYGSYQIGFTHSIPYATKLREIIKEMKNRDPKIKILAAAYGYHNTKRDKGNKWTDRILKTLGECFDLIDVHAYVYGPRSKNITPEEIPELKKAFMGSIDSFEVFLDDLRDLLNSRTKTENVKVALLEWGILPYSWKNAPRRQTFANALIVATFYNSLIRNGDLVQQAAAHNYSFCVSPVGAHSEPVNPRTYILKLYSEMSNNKLIQVDAVSQTFSVHKSYRGIGVLSNVYEIDSVGTSDDNGKVRIAIVNRSTENDYNIAVHVQGKPIDLSARLEKLTSDIPYQRYLWTNNVDPVKKTVNEIQSTNNYFNIFVPKMGFAYLTFPETIKIVL